LSKPDATEPGGCETICEGSKLASFCQKQASISWIVATRQEYPNRKYGVAFRQSAWCAGRGGSATMTHLQFGFV
jgi:hypothetical protein